MKLCSISHDGEPEVGGFVEIGDFLVVEHAEDLVDVEDGVAHGLNVLAVAFRACRHQRHKPQMVLARFLVLWLQAVSRAALARLRIANVAAFEKLVTLMFDGLVVFLRDAGNVNHTLAVRHHDLHNHVLVARNRDVELVYLGHEAGKV